MAPFAKTSYVSLPAHGHCCNWPETHKLLFIPIVTIVFLLYFVSHLLSSKWPTLRPLSVKEGWKYITLDGCLVVSAGDNSPKYMVTFLQKAQPKRLPWNTVIKHAFLHRVHPIIILAQQRTFMSQWLSQRNFKVRHALLHTIGLFLKT